MGCGEGHPPPAGKEDGRDGRAEGRGAGGVLHLAELPIGGEGGEAEGVATLDAPVAPTARREMKEEEEHRNINGIANPHYSSDRGRATLIASIEVPEGF
mmetsp:Transcript_52924/g.158437  ORF Transcript_52924/g.158437 Transcript_52924/m.158437 type:complete len:99 (+) Transcript_52924:1248-1544(+)